jgi:hypothetical protein
VDNNNPVHIKPMKETPKVKTEAVEKTTVQSSDLQREIYLRLVSSAASDGRFLLGNLPNANAVVKQGDHLRGVSELLASCYEK